ncbi:hypothetical protein Tco_0699293 [Tanacetum coccineum]
MTPATSSTGLGLNYVLSVPCLRHKKRMIGDVFVFKPMFDEYFNPPTIAVSPVQEAAALRDVVLVDSPVQLPLINMLHQQVFLITMNNTISNHILKVMEDVTKNSTVVKDASSRTTHRMVPFQQEPSKRFTWLRGESEKIGKVYFTSSVGSRGQRGWGVRGSKDRLAETEEGLLERASVQLG